MHYCEHCQRNFKTVQGLLGHQRMAHNSDSGEPMQSVAVMKTMPGCVEERLERIEGLLGRMKILVSAVAVGIMPESSGSLEERLNRIEGLWTKELILNNFL